MAYNFETLNVTKLPNLIFISLVKKYFIFVIKPSNNCDIKKLHDENYSLLRKTVSDEVVDYEMN